MMMLKRIQRHIEDWGMAIEVLANTDDDMVAEAVDQQTAMLFDDVPRLWLDQALIREDSK